MYVIPGTVLVGLGFRAAKSAAHCIDGPSAHIGGSPTAFGLPGIQVNPLEPSRKTTMRPCPSFSMIFADLAISGGPADIALSIFSCALLVPMTAACGLKCDRAWIPSLV